MPHLTAKQFQMQKVDPRYAASQWPHLNRFGPSPWNLHCPVTPCRQHLQWLLLFKRVINPSEPTSLSGNAILIWRAWRTNYGQAGYVCIIRQQIAWPCSQGMNISGLGNLFEPLLIVYYTELHTWFIINNTCSEPRPLSTLFPDTLAM